MCGICGEINFRSNISLATVQAMMKKMKHRGPDDEGIFVNEERNLALGFVRLSIIDLSMKAHQPFHSADGRYVIVINGEVYNYLEIKQELLTLGYTFLSTSDSEVVLYSYIQWGEACLHKFNGMFAFAVYDTVKHYLFAARDRYGVKPFYYYSSPDQFLFASEIPALSRALSQKPKADEQAIYDFLVYNRTDQTENTFFKGIRKLQHGHCIGIDTNTGLTEIHKWYDLTARLDKPFNSPDEFQELFSSSCGLRLRSDVPVGVCFSGGLDSSSVVSVLLRDHHCHEINTFSAIYGKSEVGDESHFINLFRDRLRNMHFVSPDSNSLAADIYDFVEALGEPVPSSSVYAQYKVCELAKKSVTVALDGQGADEYMAGYLYFYGFHFKELLKKKKFSKLASELYHYIAEQKSLFGVKAFLYFMLPASTRSGMKADKSRCLMPGFVRQYGSSSKITSDIYNSSSLQDALLDHFEFKLEHNLLWNDKNSMRFSLELREPMLDYRLVERTLASNMDLIINKGFTKVILREAMKGYLPEEIRLRKDKVGFATPEDKWFRTPFFAQLLKEIIHDERFISRGIIDVKSADKLLEDHLNMRRNVSKELWKFLSLELWFRAFID
jgi:asparagine synthase (glutamine-hydrolysing)